MRLLSYLIYITCPACDVETIIDETRSYSNIRQTSRLDEFIIQALKAMLHEKSRGVQKVTNSNKTRAHSKVATALRLVCSDRILSTSKNMPVIDDCSQTSISHPQSPFSSAFMQSSIIDFGPKSIISIQPSGDKKNEDSSQIDVKPNSLHTSFSGSHDSIQLYERNAGMQWTRTRVKALESQIRSITSNTSQHGANIGINITKDMLCDARFIAQVELKFLIVRMKGIICAIDQHAADERIGLERLEKALLDKVCGNSHDSDKKILVQLSKKKNIALDELFKYVPLQQPHVFNVSPTQIQTIENHKKTINNWKFNFTVNSCNEEVTLNGVPGICDKVACSKDFVAFLQAIETRSTDVSLVRPAFVKRALSSYACRYAIMFGDPLSDDQCTKIITDLSKCDMSFICAHGRPSIVPLIDLDNSLWNEEDTKKSVKSTHLPVDSEHAPQRFYSEKYTNYC